MRYETIQPIIGTYGVTSHSRRNLCAMILSDFDGQWALTRTIDDALSGQQSRFQGSATFTPDIDQSIYHESGRLILPNAPPMTSERRYFWRQSDTGIDVFFDDNRPFHSFSDAQTTSAHWCDPDQYDVSYDFSTWPMWGATWRVKGPRKDYTMQSLFVR